MVAPGAMPFEFPIEDKTEALAGEKVFYVNMKLINNALAEGKTEFSTQFLLGTMGTPGDKQSGVKFVGEDMVPNSGIVRIPPGQTAKKGDIIIGEWGASMFRGIVVDAKDPKAPKAIFIGLSYDNPAKADDGKTLRVLAGHSGSARSVSVSPDGRTLASGAADKSVRLW